MRTCHEPGVILTYTGVKFTPMTPRIKDVRITDIAHALSQICRFTGHTSEFYSVAQHSLAVSYMVPQELALWGLLHDATETYLTDIALPLKVLPEYDFYRAAEKRLSDVIMTTFGLPVEEPPEVKAADREACKQEGATFLWNWSDYPEKSFVPPSYEPPHEVREAFLERFHGLN